MPIVEVDDRAVGVECRGDGALAAEHAFGAEAFDETVDVPHAVQKRQNSRRWADCLGEGCHRAFEVEGFAAQHHEIERLASLLQHNRRRSAVEVAEGAANRQTMLCKLGGTTRTNEKRYVAARLQQTSAEIAPDRARSHNKNSHVTCTLLE